MTTAEAPAAFRPYRVSHPLHGVGLVIRNYSRTHVDVQWPGILLVRREHVDTVERYVEPTPEPTRRSRRG